MDNSKGKNLTPREILDTFSPECLPVIRRNLSLLKKKKKEIEPICKELLEETIKEIFISEVSEGYKENLFIPWARYYFFEQIIDPLERQIDFLEKLLKMEEFKKGNEKELSPEDIDRAKAVNLKDYLRKDIDTLLCPFHPEKTPSFHLYKNRFHCFGCGKDGDIIQYVMETEKKSFREAVLILLKK